MAIRHATHADADAFSAIMSDGEAQTWASLENPTSRALIAVQTRGTPIGFVEARKAGDDVEILMIATRPEERRSGVAAALLAALTLQAMTEGARRIILEVAEDNVAGRGLYDHTGFVEIGRRPAYYHHGRETPCDALLLARQFDSAMPWQA